MDSAVNTTIERFLHRKEKAMKIHLPPYEPLLKENEHLRHGEINIDLGEDVVKVVRCKDCEYWVALDNGFSYVHKGRTDGVCNALVKYHDSERYCTQQDHFCGYGKRKGAE